MTRTKGPMRWAGIFLAISAVMHIVGLLVGGFASTLQLLGAAVLYAVFAYAMLLGMRSVGYVAFVVVFIGLSVAISGLWSTGPIPPWVFGAISAANIATVVCLFVALWKPAEPATS